MTTFVTHSPDETESLGETLSSKIHSGHVVAFTGNMGMGKTVFIRGIARGFGVTSGVASPTFTIMREYDGSIPIYHFDMYRITGLDDLYSCGFFDYLEGDGILLVEWSENIKDFLPENTIFIHINFGETDTDRIIKIDGAGY